MGKQTEKRVGKQTKKKVGKQMNQEKRIVKNVIGFSQYLVS